MNQHKGDIVRGKCYDSGMKMNDIADGMDVTRRTLYNWLDTFNLDIHKITRIGKIIKHDFAAEFKELRPIQYKEIEDGEALAAADQKPAYGGKPTVSLTIDLDGSEELLNHWLGVMKKVNSSL